jgi:flagellar motor component MotA
MDAAKLILRIVMPAAAVAGVVLMLASLAYPTRQASLIAGAILVGASMISYAVRVRPFPGT